MDGYVVVGKVVVLDTHWECLFCCLLYDQNWLTNQLKYTGYKSCTYKNTVMKLNNPVLSITAVISLV